MENIAHLLYDFLISYGLTDNLAKFLNMLAILLIVLLFILIIHFITKRIIIKIATTFSGKSKTNFDDLLISNSVPRNIAHVISVLIAIESLQGSLF